MYPDTAVSWQLAVAAMTSLCRVLVLAMMAGWGHACLGPIFDVIFPTPAPTTAPPATGLRLSISVNVLLVTVFFCSQCVDFGHILMMIVPGKS